MVLSVVHGDISVMVLADETGHAFADPRPSELQGAVSLSELPKEHVTATW